MPDDAPTANERLTAMVGYLSLFTCLPVVFWPGLSTGTPFVRRHTNFARGWYVGMLASIALTVAITIASFGFNNSRGTR